MGEPDICSEEDCLKLARTLKGELWKSSRGYVIKLKVGDARARIELGTPFRALFELPNQPLVVELFREPPGFSIDRFFGAEDIETGDAAFDERYVIRGKPLEQVRRFFSKKVRELIAQLDDTAQFSLRLTHDTLEVRFGRIKTGPERALKLSTVAIELARHILASNSDGLEIYENIQTGRCPICGHSTDSGGVSCPRCGTRCHRDCWDYNGRCPVFGCTEPGERRVR